MIETNAPRTITEPLISPSALNVGLEGIDPDFVRLIEMSLMAMTDYARNKVNFEKHSGMRLVMTRDIERAEKILRRIADWHETSNA